MKTAIIVSNGDDWQGVYIDGKIVTQGHQLRVDDILVDLGYTVDNLTVNHDWLDKEAWLPDNFYDVVLKGDYE